MYYFIKYLCHWGFWKCFMFPFNGSPCKTFHMCINLANSSEIKSLVPMWRMKCEGWNTSLSNLLTLKNGLPKQLLDLALFLHLINQNIETFLCRTDFKSVKVKHELQVASFKFRYTSYEFNVMSHEFKFTSYEFKSTSYEFRSTNYEFKSTSYEFKRTS